MGAIFSFSFSFHVCLYVYALMNGYEVKKVIRRDITHTRMCVPKMYELALTTASINHDANNYCWPGRVTVRLDLSEPFRTFSKIMKWVALLHITILISYFVDDVFRLI